MHLKGAEREDIMKIEDAKLKAGGTSSFEFEYDLEFNLTDYSNIPFMVAFTEDDEDDTQNMRAEIIKRVNAYDELVQCVLRNRIAWDSSKDKTQGLLPEVYLTINYLIGKLGLEKKLDSLRKSMKD